MRYVYYTMVVVGLVFLIGKANSISGKLDRIETEQETISANMRLKNRTEGYAWLIKSTNGVWNCTDTKVRRMDK